LSKQLSTEGVFAKRKAHCSMMRCIQLTLTWTLTETHLRIFGDGRMSFVILIQAILATAFVMWLGIGVALIFQKKGEKKI
jgi:hypothetical protein